MVALISRETKGNQRNLKGESVVAAILPSHMEVSYCTTRFVHSLTCQIIPASVRLPFLHGLKLCSASCGNNNVHRSCQIRRYSNSPRYMQGCSVGVWRPGQKVKLAPLVLIFSKKFFKMVNPKQISVIFKSDKKNQKKQGVPNSF